MWRANKAILPLLPTEGTGTPGDSNLSAFCSPIYWYMLWKKKRMTAGEVETTGKNFKTVPNNRRQMLKKLQDIRALSTNVMPSSGKLKKRCTDNNKKKKRRKKPRGRWCVQENSVISLLCALSSSFFSSFLLLSIHLLLSLPDEFFQGLFRRYTLFFSSGGSVRWPTWSLTV